jgi:bilin biosynthesis protein
MTMSQDALFERLKHPNPNLRDQATVELIETRDDQTIDRLMSALDDADTTYRRAAVKALGLVGADTVPALVEALLNSENVTVRGSAAKALAQVAICYPDDPFPELGMQGLQQSLSDANPVVYIAATMALGEIGQQGFAILAESLKTTDNVALQVSIVNALASVGGADAAAVLQQVTEDTALDDYVKETAVSALSRLEFVEKNSWSG